MVLPTETLEESACGPQKGWILEALNLQGLKEWPKAEQEQGRELLLKWENLFAHSDTGPRQNLDQELDQVNRSDTLQGVLPMYTPHMYDDVKAHLQGILDIGAIRKSHSLWILVSKKDGSLRFCIDLRKLNNQTVKDAYSPPHIDETSIACRDHNGPPYLT